MEIKIENYLSESEIKQIVIDEVRLSIREHFVNETNAKRLLSNLSYEIVYDEVDKIVPNSRQLVYDTVVSVIKDIKNYSVFRDAAYGGKKSLAYEIMEQAVRDNKDMINAKVKETIINKDYSKEIWEKFEELAETFISNICAITELGKRKN